MINNNSVVEMSAGDLFYWIFGEGQIEKVYLLPYNMKI